MTFIYHWLKTPSFCFKNGKKKQFRIDEKITQNNDDKSAQIAQFW